VTTIGRAFVAVVPPAEVLDAVDAAAALVHGSLSGARWTTREQRHITLQFLGNRVDLDATADALRPLAVSSGTARLGGAGTFPKDRRARVLWLGFVEGVELFAQLVAAVGALLQPLGHEPEARPFHPHLTLARCKTPADARPAIAELGEAAVGPVWPVEEVVLFESRLSQTGAEYVPFARFPLRGRH
jgi:RNA 2',3'-cyclic 3'-phosphodiesterase